MTAPTLPVAAPTPARQARIALAVVLAYSGLILISNALAWRGGGDVQSPWMQASGALMAFVAIPVFAIVLPLRLAWRWQLPYAWWPRRAQWPAALALVAGYTYLVNFDAVRALAAGPFDGVRFAVHFVSAMLFHVPYYLLFAVLLMPALARAMPLARAVAATAAVFSLYHLTQWFFFAEGTQPGYLVLLFVAFMADLAVYLLSRSLGLIMLSHSVSGAVNIARTGTWYDDTGFVFWVTLVLVGGIFAFAALGDRRHRVAGDGHWLRLRQGP